jgi:hypothetical protein
VEMSIGGPRVQIFAESIRSIRSDVAFSGDPFAFVAATPIRGFEELHRR